MSAITLPHESLASIASRLNAAPRPRTATVSVIIPCYNEEKFIGKALEQLIHQHSPTSYEIILIDGMSQDATRAEIERFQKAHPEVVIRLLENPARTIPAALNIGINAARGEIIARIDAHTAPSRRYIRRCVEVLESGVTEIVGMPCRVKAGGTTTMARAIASAVSHPFGIGDATYRLAAGKALQEEVDTVAFACFRKSLWTELGGYDETLLTNEDYDFNYRTRAHGGRVLLDRSEHCEYFARATLLDLASQYLRYGSWKARMVRRQPRSIKPRHLVAPLFVLSAATLAVAGLWNPLARALLAVEFAIYLAAAACFAIQAARRDRAGLGAVFVLPFVFFTIHFCWGSSFLLGLVRPR